MDGKLIAWARAVKARGRRVGVTVPPLWIFTDRERLPDPRAIVERLPRGLCGVVLRIGDGGSEIMAPSLAHSLAQSLARSLARLCRERRFVLVVAGWPRLAAALNAGQHLSRGRGARGAIHGLITASAHGRRELVQARRQLAAAVFLSPIFATLSHPGGAWLGVVRWTALTQRIGVPVLALGGIDGSVVRRLPRCCAGVGVIGAAAQLGV